MRVRSLLIGVLLVGLAIGVASNLQKATSATELDFSKLLAQLEPGVVQVFPVLECEVETGKVPIQPLSGSGFIIGGKQVVTDWHVVEAAAVAPTFKGAPCEVKVEGRKVTGVLTGASTIWILVPQEDNPQEFRKTADGQLQIFTGTIKRGNALHDLALLDTNITNPHRVWMGDSSTVDKGDGGFAIGYPAPNGELTVTEHQISNHFQVRAGALALALAIVVDGTLYELIPWLPPIEQDGTLVFRQAMLPAPAGFSMIPVDVVFNLETGTFTKCAVNVQGAEEVSCGVEEGVREFLQTDDAVDAGNSGGPIFNWNGQVIGVADLEPSRVDLETGFLRVTAEYHTTINKAKEILDLDIR